MRLHKNFKESVKGMSLETITWSNTMMESQTNISADHTSSTGPNVGNEHAYGDKCYAALHWANKLINLNQSDRSNPYWKRLYALVWFGYNTHFSKIDLDDCMRILKTMYSTGRFLGWKHAMDYKRDQIAMDWNSCPVDWCLSKYFMLGFITDVTLLTKNGHRK